MTRGGILAGTAAIALLAGAVVLLAFWTWSAR